MPGGVSLLLCRTGWSRQVVVPRRLCVRAMRTCLPAIAAAAVAGKLQGLGMQRVLPHSFVKVNSKSYTSPHVPVRLGKGRGVSPRHTNMQLLSTTFVSWHGALASVRAVRDFSRPQQWPMGAGSPRAARAQAAGVPPPGWYTSLPGAHHT